MIHFRLVRIFSQGHITILRGSAHVITQAYLRLKIRIIPFSFLISLKTHTFFTYMKPLYEHSNTLVSGSLMKSKILGRLLAILT